MRFATFMSQVCFGQFNYGEVYNLYWYTSRPFGFGTRPETCMMATIVKPTVLTHSSNMPCLYPSVRVVDTDEILILCLATNFVPIVYIWQRHAQPIDSVVLFTESNCEIFITIPIYLHMPDCVWGRIRWQWCSTTNQESSSADCTKQSSNRCLYQMRICEPIPKDLVTINHI